MSAELVDRLNAALSGRYAIEGELGEGGMASVYLAADLRHERRVALKVLKPELAAVVGADRFLAEIKTTANLQHPQILPLFDSGEADEFLFYVMPYVEGESLRDKLERERQLPVEEAIRIASDVAEALHAAHEQGVIHRDIKPANILLSRGRSLVADFGIALGTAAVERGRLTETGLSLGTPYYMSPEQASGDEEPTASSDIYSLGCVLYEMLVGEPPHVARSAQAVLAKILTGDLPSPTGERASIPAHVDAAIRKALERLPADRFGSADELASALADPAFRHGSSRASALASAGRWRRLALALGATAALFAGVAAWAISRAPVPPPVERFAAPFGESVQPGFAGTGAFDLAADGSLLVYQGPSSESGGQLWVRHWASLTPAPIRGTVVAMQPAVSPDGQDVAFARRGDIEVVPIAGGPLRTLTTGSWPRWGPAGSVYATSEGAIVRVASDGSVETVLPLAEGDTDQWITEVLPGGRGALLTVSSGNGSEVRSLHPSDGRTELLVAGSFARYAPTGHLLYLAADSSLMAARFDAGSMQLTGPAERLVDGVDAFSISNTGKLFYTRGLQDSEFVWVSRTGQAAPVDPGWSVDVEPGSNPAWSLSPDGTRLAVRATVDGNQDIWIKELPDGAFSRITFDEADDWSPYWAPDGLSVAFVSIRAGDRDVWTKAADGTGTAELLYDHPTRVVEAFWSPDGEWLVIRGGAAGAETNTRDILGLRPGVDTLAVPLLAEAYDEQEPALSHDGRWLAYVSNETGANEVFVRPFPDVDAGKWRVSTAGGLMPVWAHNGRELFYMREEDRLLTAVSYQSEPEFRVLDSQPLFVVPPEVHASQRNVLFGISQDDQYFLMARPYQPAGGSPFVLVTNFFEELKAIPGG